VKLLEITFKTAPRIPGVRQSDLSQIRLTQPPEQLKGWRVSIRGATVFFISPPNWKAPGRPEVGKSTIHEVPRMNCFFWWEGDASDLVDVHKGYDSQPFGPEFVPAADADENGAKTSKKTGGLLDQVPGIVP
jgi:hypothetical protein